MREFYQNRHTSLPSGKFIRPYQRYKLSQDKKGRSHIYSFRQQIYSQGLKTYIYFHSRYNLIQKT